ncbi:MAG: hypothetical protein QG632_822 [Candidatus Dependentiae bacterium]|nr:hypothetical protein [Candidatus Dependentiae bacterium]
MKRIGMRSLHKMLLVASVCTIGNVCVVASLNDTNSEINNTLPTIAILGGLAAAGLFGYKAYRLSCRIAKLRERVVKYPNNVELQEKLERVSRLYNTRLMFVGGSLGLAAFGGLSYKRKPKSTEPSQNNIVLAPDVQTGSEQSVSDVGEPKPKGPAITEPDVSLAAVNLQGDAQQQAIAGEGLTQARATAEEILSEDEYRAALSKIAGQTDFNEAAAAAENLLSFNISFAKVLVDVMRKIGRLWTTEFMKLYDFFARQKRLTFPDSLNNYRRYISYDYYGVQSDDSSVVCHFIKDLSKDDLNVLRLGLIINHIVEEINNAEYAEDSESVKNLSHFIAFAEAALDGASGIDSDATRKDNINKRIQYLKSIHPPIKCVSMNWSDL